MKIRFGDKIIEEVNEYIFLRQVITPENKVSNEINRDWLVKFWQILHLPEKNLYLNKIKIINEIVLSAITYDCEMWSFTNKQRQKLSVAQRSMERASYKISQKKTSGKLKLSEITHE